MISKYSLVAAMFPTNQDLKPSNACMTWMSQCLKSDNICAYPLPEHAHQKKHYFTIIENSKDTKMLLVEASGDISSLIQFITLSKILHSNGIHTPQIYHQQIQKERCWILMSHFGHETLLDWLLNHNEPDKKAILMSHCLQEIKNFQAQTINYPAPTYQPEDILRDMELAEHFFLGQLLEITPSAAAKARLSHAKMHILDTFQKLPERWMHFDFHSANIMLLPQRTLGILDFQDLKVGPINYDLMSLLTDHYYTHSAKEIDFYIQKFYQISLETNPDLTLSAPEFHEACMVVAVQRHLKNIGIFSRLFFRNKPHYLQHIPKMMTQLQALCERTGDLGRLVETVWSEHHANKFQSLLQKASIS
jgi:aminoglycoside/choline kinase family phosphotransferase